MLPRVAPPPKKPPVNWEEHWLPAAVPRPLPVLSPHVNTHACTGWIHPELSHLWHQPFLCGLCQTGWARLLMLRGLCAPFTPSKRHLSTHCLACTPKHSMTVGRSQHGHPTGSTRMYLGVHIGFCAHICNKYMHVSSVCLSVRIHMCSHAHELARMCIQASSPPVCAHIHSCAHTHMLTEMLVHGHVFTGTQGAVSMQGGMSAHICACTHISAHTCAHIHVHACAHLCMCTHRHKQHGHVHTYTSVHTHGMCIHILCAHIHVHRRVCVHMHKCL